MVLIVIIIGGLAVQELHLAHEVGVHLACEQFGGIKPIGLSIHHFGQAWNELVAPVNGDVDFRGHRLVALGLDEQYAIGALGPIKGCSVLQYLYTLDVVHVEVGQQVVEVAVMKQFA